MRIIALKREALPPATPCYPSQRGRYEVFIHSRVYPMALEQLSSSLKVNIKVLRASCFYFIYSRFRTTTTKNWTTYQRCSYHNYSFHTFDHIHILKNTLVMDGSGKEGLLVIRTITQSLISISKAHQEES